MVPNIYIYIYRIAPKGINRECIYIYMGLVLILTSGHLSDFALYGLWEGLIYGKRIFGEQFCIYIKKCYTQAIFLFFPGSPAVVYRV